MNLYNKYRPRRFADIVGNDQLKSSLQAVLKRAQSAIPHVFLLQGPSGCGKTTIARILARRLGCKSSDRTELDVGDFRGIDTVREIRKQMPFAPMYGSCRVWYLDEVHALTSDAQRGLLKALEDTPAHVYFILSTSEPNKLLKAVRNRCVSFTVEELTEEEITQILNFVCEAEGKKISTKMKSLIATNSLGSPRAALTMLEKMIDMDASKAEKLVEKFAEDENVVLKLCRAFFQRPTWSQMAALLKTITTDPEQVRRAVLGYFTSVLLSKDEPTAYIVLDSFSQPFYDTGRAGLVKACYEVVSAK